MFYTCFLFVAMVASVFSVETSNEPLVYQRSYAKLVSKESLKEMIQVNGKFFSSKSIVEVPKIGIQGENEEITLKDVKFKMTPYNPKLNLLNVTVSMIENEGVKVTFQDIKFKINGTVDNKSAYIEGNITNFYCIVNFTIHSIDIKEKLIFAFNALNTSVIDCDIDIDSKSIKIVVDKTYKEDNELKRNIIRRINQIIPKLHPNIKKMIDRYLIEIFIETIPEFINLIKHTYLQENEVKFINDSIIIHKSLPFKNFDKENIKESKMPMMNFDNSKTSEIFIDENLLNLAMNSYFKTGEEFGFSLSQADLSLLAGKDKDIEESLDNFFKSFDISTFKKSFKNLHLK